MSMIGNRNSIINYFKGCIQFLNEKLILFPFPGFMKFYFKFYLSLNLFEKSKIVESFFKGKKTMYR